MFLIFHPKNLRLCSDFRKAIQPRILPILFYISLENIYCKHSNCFFPSDGVCICVASEVKNASTRFLPVISSAFYKFYRECLLFQMLLCYVTLIERLIPQTRLQQFALGIQGYIRTLREFLTGKTAAQLASEHKKKATALKSATNINSLIKDFLHPTPSYKTKVGLSWKPVNVQKAGAKRKSISFEDVTSPKADSGPKRKFAKTPIRSGAQGGNRGGGAGLYAPPTGKYSSGLQTSFGETTFVFPSF